MPGDGKRVIFVVNRSEFFLSHRLPVAKAARRNGYEVHVTTPLEIPDGGQLIKKEGFTWHELPLKGDSLNPLKEIQVLNFLLQLYRKLKPDLVHHVALKPILYGGIAARLSGVPAVVAAFTGLGYLFSNQDLKARLLRHGIMTGYRVALNHPSSRVIFQNQDDQDLFVQRNIIDPDDSTVIRGSGVNTATFNSVSRPSTPPVVLMASRMVQEKGVEIFIKAARKIRDQCDARFVLAGEADHLNPNSISTSQLEEWNREPSIEWWGHCDNMPRIFSESTIVCLPTYYREGVPKVLIEAASCSRPLITTDTPGCRDIVRHRSNGELVPPRDVTAVAKATLRLLKNPKLREEYGSNGRQLVKKKFDVDYVISETLQVYQELLD